MPDPLLLVAELLLALTFTWAVVAKAFRWSVWMESLDGYGFEGAARRAVAISVPVAELAVASLIVLGPVRAGLAASLFLVSIFSFGILQARSRGGDRVPCGCFGKTDERDYRWLLVRNGLLAALAGTALLGGADESVVSLTEAPSSSEILPALLVSGGVVLLAWLGWIVVTLMRKEHS